MFLWFFNMQSWFKRNLMKARGMPIARAYNLMSLFARFFFLLRVKISPCIIDFFFIRIAQFFSSCHKMAKNASSYETRLVHFGLNMSQLELFARKLWEADVVKCQFLDGPCLTKWCHIKTMKVLLALSDYLLLDNCWVPRFMMPRKSSVSALSQKKLLPSFWYVFIS